MNIYVNMRIYVYINVSLSFSSSLSLSIYIYIYMHIYIYIFFFMYTYTHSFICKASKVKLVTVVEGNPKAPFSLASTPKSLVWLDQRLNLGPRAISEHSTHLHKNMCVYIYIYCPVSWGCRIHLPHLCRGVRPSLTSVLDMTRNNLMVRFQQCRSFGEWVVPFYCPRSKVHSGPEW